ncbi:MAG TPA: polyprenyl synthetase family protein, partial [Candidatus Saccharimonadales bacterium]
MSIEIAQHKLTEYRQKLDDHIAQYVAQEAERTARQYGELGAALTSPFAALLQNGGKRLRGALTMHAYAMFGGTDDQLVVRAARIVEMIHTYLLIVDDIADQSALRRGQPSAYRAIADFHQAQKLHGSSQHYGESQAVNSALAGLHKALADLGTLPIDDTRKLEAMNSLNEAIGMTVQGQVFDLYYQAQQDASESAVRDTLTLKTAYYSFLQPLEFGAILAGADTSEHSWLSNFARHIGLSFQITDDILGTFGTEFDSGKSALDDLREG